MIYFMLSFFSYILIIFFFSSSHPLFMSTMIALQSVLIGLTIYFFTSISWFSYLLFMIFLSGMMVILIYISSLASNLLMNYFVTDLKNLIMLMLLFMSFYFLTIKMNYFYDNNMNFSNLSNLILLSVKVYSKEMYMFTVMIICYLLALLILVVKNSLFTKGPLRSSL
uniref:NADH dehydrogenase subunit 6 n=1 Tax=Metacrangonyx sp. 1 MDMBR-2012 TaxID=1200660 RepID=K7ZWL5_9CRUS|nr:NADH dehydrogenase subunit 6 [Metacrangonyx sp. 1 MDMBR-2012]